MLTDAIEYFTGVESETRVELLTNIAAVFEQYGFSGPDVDSSMAIDDARSKNEAANVVWDKLYVIIEAGLDNLLVNMGLSLINSTILHKIELLNGMYIVENTDMHDYIIDTINNDAVGTREKFETLIEFGLGQYAGWLDNELEYVPETLLTRLLDIHLPFQSGSDEYSAPKDIRPGIQRIKLFYKYCEKNNTRLRLHELIEAGVRPGTPKDFLLSNNIDYLTDYEPTPDTPSSADLAAMQLVGLLLLCDIDFTTITEISSQLAELYFTDIAFAGQVSTESNRIISESGVQGDLQTTDETAGAILNG